MSRVVKIEFENVIRRFSLPEQNGFKALGDIVAKTFGFVDFVAKYQDDEGELCTISSDLELEEAFRLTSEQGLRSLKLVVTRTGSKKSEPLVFVGVEDVKAASPKKPVAIKVAKKPASPKKAAPASEPKVEPKKAAPKKPASPKVEPKVEPKKPASPKKEELTEEQVVALAKELLDDQTFVEAVVSQVPEVLKAFFETEKPVMDIVNQVVESSDVIRNKAALQKLLPALPALIEKKSECINRIRRMGSNGLAGFMPLIFSFMGANGSQGVSPLAFLLPQLMSGLRLQDESEPEDEKNPTHRHIVCDVCNASPIVGVRYKCTVCDDYDMCEACEAKGEHDPHHVLLKMRRPRRHGHPRHFGHPHHHHHRRPSHGPHPFGPAASFGPFDFPVPFEFGRGCRRRSRCSPEPQPERPLRLHADFVGDVTIPDQSHCRPNVTLKKVWRLRNTSNVPFPQGVRVLFTEGSVRPANVDGNIVKTEVAQVETGTDVDVSVDVVTPSEPGRHFGYFTLATPSGTPFGPAFWIDVVVVAEPEKKEAEEPKPQAKAAAADSSSDDDDDEIQAPVSPATQAPVSSSSPGKPAFQYSDALKTVMSMGFADEDLVKYILLTKNGDVQASVEWLLAHASV